MNNCRLCGEAIDEIFLDLGQSPLSNGYLNEEQKGESQYPLIAYRCKKCFLVQLDEFATPEDIFSHYHYFSSFASSWVEHSKHFCDVITRDLKLDSDSFVIEIASNDGYLLKNFLDKNIPVLGIEPARNVAEKAIKKNIPTKIEFFTSSLAQKISKTKKADLIIANNVLAHVPDINDFVKGIKISLADGGVISIEFPSLLNLYEETLFDTIYHEHFSYLSLNSVVFLFKKIGLRVYKVENLNTHGGSLRILGCHQNDPRPEHCSVNRVLQEELASKVFSSDFTNDFQERVDKIAKGFRAFLKTLAVKNEKIVAYGAAAKGNTFLNYCGVTSSDIPYVVDKNIHKQSLLLPGSRIPILSPDVLYSDRDVTHVLILPWNLKSEIILQIEQSMGNKVKFVTAIPEITIT